MSDIESAGNCECCRAALYGHLGVFDGELYGASVIIIREMSPRNWICCDACAAMLCHACCTYPQSGYCDSCIAKYSIQVACPELHATTTDNPVTARKG